MDAALDNVSVESEDEEEAHLALLSQRISSSVGKRAVAASTAPVDPFTLPGALPHRVASRTPAAAYAADAESSENESEDTAGGLPANFHLLPREKKLQWLATRDDAAVAPSVWRRTGGAPRVVGLAKGAADRETRLEVSAAVASLSDEQEAALAALAVPWQRHLQRLLWHLGCQPVRYKLYEHQFDAALLCAGIQGPVSAARLEVTPRARSRHGETRMKPAWC
jgi:hypothetical protein